MHKNAIVLLQGMERYGMVWCSNYNILLKWSTFVSPQVSRLPSKSRLPPRFINILNKSIMIHIPLNMQEIRNIHSGLVSGRVDRIYGKYCI